MSGIKKLALEGALSIALDTRVPDEQWAAMCRVKNLSVEGSPHSMEARIKAKEILLEAITKTGYYVEEKR